MKNNIIKFAVCTSCILVAPFLCVAQEEKPTKEDVEKSIGALEKQVTHQEAKIQRITSRMLELDEGIEKKVSGIVEHLSSVRDSTETRTKVASSKQDAMQALAQSADFYASERAKRMTELKKRHPDMPRKQLAKQIGTLDARIEDRIDQIVEITTSLTQHEDFKRYERHYKKRSGRSSRGKWRSKKKTTKEYKQNRLETAKTDTSKTKVAEGLEKSIEELERDNARLERSLKSAHSNKEKALIEGRIQKNKETIEKRKKQIDSVVASPKPATTQIGAEEFSDMDERIGELALQIQDDHKELLKLDAERDRELVRLKPLKSRLARARKRAGEME